MNNPTDNQKSEAARVLGRIKSIKKTMSSQLNGMIPCRPGKKRGRPHKKDSVKNES